MKLHRRDVDYPALYEDMLNMVRRTLREDWDPLGVSDLPAAYDEYDSYAPGIATMLMHGVDGNAWTDRREHLLQTLGLSDACEVARAAEIFDVLKNRAIDLTEKFYA